MKAQENLFNQQRVFRYRIGKITNGLAVPSRHKGQPMGDVFQFNIHRRWIQQIQSTPRKHPLPSARLFHGKTANVNTGSSIANQCRPVKPLIPVAAVMALKPPMFSRIDC